MARSRGSDSDTSDGMIDVASVAESSVGMLSSIEYLGRVANDAKLSLSGV